MDGRDLTLLQRLWSWIEETGRGTLTVSRIAEDEFAPGAQPYYWASADRGPMGSEHEAAAGGWEKNLSDSLRQAARSAGFSGEVEQQPDPAVRLSIELNQIRSALGRVAQYRDLMGPSPIPLLVDDLVRDHERIETRIDAVASAVVAAREDPDASPQLLALCFEIGEIIAGRREFTDARELTEELGQ